MGVELDDRELARLYYEKYKAHLATEESVGIDDFDDLDDSDIRAIAVALRYVLQEQREPRS